MTFERLRPRVITKHQMSSVFFMSGMKLFFMNYAPATALTHRDHCFLGAAKIFQQRLDLDQEPVQLCIQEVNASAHKWNSTFQRAHVLRLSSSLVSDTAQETWTLMLCPAA